MKKVLIMEDELNIRSFVVINLKRAGYDAIEAGNGQEALDAIALSPQALAELAEVSGNKIAAEEDHGQTV